MARLGLTLCLVHGCGWLSLHALAFSSHSSPSQTTCHSAAGSRRCYITGLLTASAAHMVGSSTTEAVHGEEVAEKSPHAWLKDLPPWEQRRSVLPFMREASAGDITWRPLEASTEPHGDDLVFPAWLAGEWDVTYSSPDPQFPLGFSFLDTTVPGVAMASILRLPNIGKETTVRWRLRPASDSSTGAQFDWAVTLPSILRGFWTKATVPEVAERDSPGWKLAYEALTSKGTQTTREVTCSWLAGRVVQQSVSTASSTFEEVISSEWLQQLEPGLGPSYGEHKYRIMTRLRRTGDDAAEGRLRVAAYLKTLDKKYFEAADRAVAIYDYTLRLQRV